MARSFEEINPMQFKPKEEPKTLSLFEDSCRLGDKEVEEVANLISRHLDVLTNTRMGTKTWDSTMNKVRQFVENTIMFAYEWDKTWLKKVRAKFPVDSQKYDFKTLMNRLDDVLSFLGQDGGDHWYIRKRGKVSLSDFLVSTMKSGAHWSPFMELSCTDFVSPRMLAMSLPESVRNMAYGAVEKAWWNVTWESTKRFMKGVLDVYMWFNENRSRLITESPMNVYAFSSAAIFFKYLFDAMEKNMRPAFVEIGSMEWKRVCDRLKDVHGIEIKNP